MESHNHPSFIETLPGCDDGRRRHLARRVHDGRAPRRLPQPAAVRIAFASQDAPSGGRRGRRHRRLRQLVRRAHGRRFDGVRSVLRRQHPRQRDGGWRGACGPHLLREGDRRRESYRLSRLQDGPRRHPRRDDGIGIVRGGCRRETPHSAGRRPLLREAPARGLPRTDGDGRDHRHPGHGRGGPHVVCRGDGRQGRSGHRARPRRGAVPRARHERLRDDAV